MKKIFFLILLLPILSFAQTKGSKNSAVAKSKATVKSKPVVKEQPPKTKPTTKSVVKAKPIVKAKPEVKPAVKAKPIVKAKPEPKAVVKSKPVVKAKPKVAEPREQLKATMHTVTAKETLYGIGKMYGAKVDELKRWNKLATDDLEEGMELIVGFGTVNKIEQIKEIQETTVTPPVEAPVEEPVVKEEPKKNPNPKVPVIKPMTEDIITDEQPTEGKNFKGGFFKSLYKDNGKILEGTAGVFKSTSGWEDGKYYCLHNSAKQGTIIKVTNTATGKSIFAKVLDIMPDLKQNDKLIIRISSAASVALGEDNATSMAVAISY